MRSHGYMYEQDNIQSTARVERQRKDEIYAVSFPSEYYY